MLGTHFSLSRANTKSELEGKLKDVTFLISLSEFQTEKHRSLNLTRQYTLEGLYPNTLYYIWLSAKSSKGEGAHTTPIKVTTEQYGKYHYHIAKGVSR